MLLSRNALRMIGYDCSLNASVGTYVYTLALVTASFPFIVSLVTLYKTEQFSALILVYYHCYLNSTFNSLHARAVSPLVGLREWEVVV